MVSSLYSYMVHQLTMLFFSFDDYRYTILYPIHYIQINRVELGLKPSSEHREFSSRSTTPDLLSTSSEFNVGMGWLWWEDGFGGRMALVGWTGQARHVMARTGMT